MLMLAQCVLSFWVCLFTICRSVCLFLSKSGIVPKGLNLGLRKRRKYDRPRNSSYPLPKIYMRNSNLLTPNLDTEIGGVGFQPISRYLYYKIALSQVAGDRVAGYGRCCHAGREWKCTIWKWRTENSQRIAGSGKAGLENDEQTFSKCWQIYKSNCLH